MSLDPKQGPIDVWSTVHLTVGFVAGIIGIEARTMLIGSLGFELLENAAGDDVAIQEVFPYAGAESLRNAGADIVVNMLGWAIGRWITRRKVFAWSDPRALSA